MPIQRTVVDVGMDVVGRASMRSKRERAMRFLEEAFELGRICGLDADDCETVLAYEFNRAAGPDLEQEFGGAGTTLYALAEAHGIYLDDTVRRETMRVAANKEKIQAKQAAKPRFVRDEALV